MKKLISSLLSFLIFFCTYAQNVAENKIRKLDNEQKEDYFRRDTAALLKLFSSHVIINGFSNKFETLQDVLSRIRQEGNNIDYYDRVIEKVIFAHNTAIVMGNETIKPGGTAVNAGKTVKRRFTNIWIPNKKSWQLVARQSTIVSIE
jgi:hypothetical protein